MKPKVSIVISVYNKCRAVKRAVKSSLRQTYGHIEVIVVDDASSDGSCDVVAGIAATDSRVILVRHPENRGLSQTRVTGLNAASGEYVMFMDADDTIGEKAVAVLLERSVGMSADIVVMASQRVSGKLPVRIPFFIPSRFFGQEKVVSARSILPVILTKNGFTLSVVDKLYRRELLEAANHMAEKEFIGEDMLLNMRVFNSDARVAWTDYVGYNWTTGGGSTMRPERMWEEDKKLYLRCRQVLGEMSADNDEFDGCLAQGLVSAFIYEIARSLVNPFASRRRIKEWIAGQLDDTFWDNVSSLPDNLSSAIAAKDAGAVFDAGKRQFMQHRLFYTVLAVM